MRDWRTVDLARPRFVFRDEVLAVRSARLEATLFEGLWVAGTLAPLGGRTVAIVGPRAPSDGARARAHALAATVARRGICVISGLALGVDGAAHAGALAGGGKTIGVLGGGHRQFFPRRNRALAEAMIANGGAVLSPYAPDEPAWPAQFLQRNGIVAALSDTVVIVEAAARSGALNTASWAASLGIDVLAFPGDVDRPKAAGCNALIRDGATLVRDADDVLAHLGVTPRSAAPEPQDIPPRTDPTERSIVAALAHGPTDFDQLLAKTATSTADLIAALVRLEMDDAIVRRDAFTYALPVRSDEKLRARVSRTTSA
jgi:DNA processing protein